MLVFDENNEALILDDIHTPIIADHFWVLDLAELDYTLAPLLVLEEIVSRTVEIMILGFRFNLPASWNMLVIDDETMQLDVEEIGKLAGREFHALVYGPNMMMPEKAVVVATDFFMSAHNVGPSLNKHQMLCHPISPEAWVNVAPSDTYNKYLRDKTSGDLI